jgi:hypothetical protein
MRIATNKLVVGMRLTEKGLDEVLVFSPDAAATLASSFSFSRCALSFRFSSLAAYLLLNLSCRKARILFERIYEIVRGGGGGGVKF